MTCCDDEWNIRVSENLLLPICIKSGSVVAEPEEVEISEYWKNALVCKTWIPFHTNYRHIHRIHRWNADTYAETELQKLYRFIEHLNLDQNVIRISKLNIKKYYYEEKIVSRSKIRLGLICYCIYTAFIYLKKDINIDDLFYLLDITCVHYNTAIKKLGKDRLFYPLEINKYLKLIGNSIDKNFLIRFYSYLIEQELKCNKKSLILGIIYWILQKQQRSTTIFVKLKIPRKSVNKICEYIDANIDTINKAIDSNSIKSS